MKVELSPKVVKYLEQLHEPMKGRIIKALRKLAHDPPQGDIKALSGQDGYRLRIGKYRLLFNMERQSITIHEIDLRGQIYKGGR